MSGQPHRRRIEVEEKGDIAVVGFIDKKILDEQNIQIIGEQLSELVDSEKRLKVILNFANVEYLSSAALGKIIALNSKLKRPMANWSCPIFAPTSKKSLPLPNWTS